MPSIDYDVTDFEKSKQSEMDKGLLVRFYTHEHPRSGELMEYVDIKVPGKTGGYGGPARIDHINRFPEHYKAFKDRTEMPDEGRSLFEWELIPTNFAEKLTHINIKTVEQLATVSDSDTQQLMGLRSFRDKAKEWLKYQEDVLALPKLEEKLDNQEIEILELQDQVKALLAKLDKGEPVDNESDDNSNKDTE